ncbi:uncharacterized protein B0J16DRAFT_402206 [Fusarium flagelliforme]|uniref:uncharacterized protein n=1 Tax=Fusarium flagelliforme TaxID=2675880 RepID=UPI001E8E78EC|nr:uncharacterized protein B0J16DRAFT_402206 [Fusarium flagelliforme]KAH7183671.1 hypothetical protein B0J16DRAFT_402206 [Fusarium flagelliforme]
MHLIYEQASFTTVASNGQDANAPLAGLFSTRDPELVGEINLKNDSILMAPARPQLPDLLAGTVWATRGWTFQEDVLSRCCLYFTSTEVFYFCKEHLKQCPLTREAGNDGFRKYDGFGIGRFNEWRESYVLETRLSKTAYQAASPWNEGWSRFGKGSSCLRSRATVLDRNGTAEEVAQSETGTTKKVRSVEDECSFNFAAQHITETGFHEEYAKFVTDYSQRQLSNPEDVVEAMIGILNKFDVTPNIEAHGMIGGQLEQDLLWVALKETSLRRRKGFPSWSWAGCIGPVVYETTAWGKSTRRWLFRPPRTYNKKEELTMKLLFDIHISAEGSLIATLKRWRLTNGPNPYPADPLPGQMRRPGRLTIYTYVAQVSSLTYKTSSIVRKDATAFNVPILVARIGNDDEEIAVIPDFTVTADPEGDFVLAMIGKGKREEETDNIGPSRPSYTLMTEYIVLLLMKRGEHFERVGLSLVPAERNIAEETRAARWKRSLMNKSLLKDVSKLRFGKKDYIDPPSCWVLQWVSLA